MAVKVINLSLMSAFVAVVVASLLLPVHCRFNTHSQCDDGHGCKSKENLLLQTRTQRSSPRKAEGGESLQEESSSDKGNALVQVSNGDVDYNYIKGIPFDVDFEGATEQRWANILYPSQHDAPASGWPAIILVHGLGSNKQKMDLVGEQLMHEAGNRLVVFNPSYNNKNKVKDIKGAYNYLRSSAVSTEYNIDTTRITLLGFSWGGNAVAELLLFDEDVYKTVHGVVLAAAFIQENTHYRDSLPLLADTSGYPPVRFIHCEDDNVAPIAEARNLLSKLDPDRTDMVTCPWPGMRHSVKGTNAEQKAWFASVVYEFLGGEQVIEPVDASPSEDVDGLWPQFGESNSKCIKGTAVRGLTQLQCQEEAFSKGHKYYQYAADANGESSCQTSAACDSPITGTGWDWKIYQAEELWPQFGNSNSKCIKGSGVRGLTQLQCQKEALSVGHLYYQYAAAGDGESSCQTSAACEAPITGTGWDWKIYSAQADN